MYVEVVYDKPEVKLVLVDEVHGAYNTLDLCCCLFPNMLWSLSTTAIPNEELAASGYSRVILAPQPRFRI